MKRGIGSELVRSSVASIVAMTLVVASSIAPSVAMAEGNQQPLPPPPNGGMQVIVVDEQPQQAPDPQPVSYAPAPQPVYAQPYAQPQPVYVQQRDAPSRAKILRLGIIGGALLVGGAAFVGIGYNQRCTRYDVFDDTYHERVCGSGIGWMMLGTAAMITGVILGFRALRKARQRRNILAQQQQGLALTPASRIAFDLDVGPNRVVPSMTLRF